MIHWIASYVRKQWLYITTSGSLLYIKALNKDLLIWTGSHLLEYISPSFQTQHTLCYKAKQLKMIPSIGCDKLKYKIFFCQYISPFQNNIILLVFENSLPNGIRPKLHTTEEKVQIIL